MGWMARIRMISVLKRQGQELLEDYTRAIEEDSVERERLERENRKVFLSLINTISPRLAIFRLIYASAFSLPLLPPFL